MSLILSMCSIKFVSIWENKKIDHSKTKLSSKKDHHPFCFLMYKVEEKTMEERLTQGERESSYWEEKNVSLLKF